MTPERPLPDSQRHREARLNDRIVRWAMWGLAVALLCMVLLTLFIWMAGPAASPAP